MTIHYEILDEKRLSLLKECAPLSGQGFYLAGGTALALYLGHRDSVDFDFFHTDSLHTEKLFDFLVSLFSTHTLVRTQEEHNTLGVLIDDTIRMSFMTFSYPLIQPLVQTEYLNLASIADIGCMKLSAITSRSAWKDYVDLYFITNTIPISVLITHLAQKMPTLDPLLALKSLIYFSDIVYEPIIYKTNPVEQTAIQNILIERVKEVSL